MSDITFKEVTSSSIATPDSTKHKVYIDSTTGHLNRKDSSGAIFDIETSGVQSGINALKLFKLVDNQGNGIVQADDGGATRGANAIDLQTSRTNDNNQIAAGAYSVVMGGRSAALKAGSIAIGYSCISSGIGSIAAGHICQAKQDYSAAIGYLAFTSGIKALALGYQDSNSSLAVNWRETLALPGVSSAIKHYFNSYSLTETATPQEIFLGSVGTGSIGRQRLTFPDSASAFGAQYDYTMGIELTAIATGYGVTPTFGANGDNQYSSMMKRHALFRATDNIIYQIGPTITVGTDINTVLSGTPSIAFSTGSGSQSVKMTITGVTDHTLTWNIFGTATLATGFAAEV